MQLHEADEVKEAYSERDANALIDKGWKLLAVTSASNPRATTATALQMLVVVYVLGLKKS